MKSHPIACLFPGQGVQRKGMGGDFLDRNASLVERADALLGYSVKSLCLEEPRRLRQTAYTQPALFVVGALAWLERRRDDPLPDLLAGHSLGEYVALFAAGCFDFETGLRLVERRGVLMADAEAADEPLGMTAIVGLDADRVREVMDHAGKAGAALDVANLNLPSQLVLSGPRPALEELVPHLEAAGAERCVPLAVSGAFHSRYMAAAAEAFETFLADFSFSPPRRPVIANATARPYPDDPAAVAPLLARQIHSPVLWSQTLALLHRRGVREIEELGPGRTLTKMWHAFLDQAPAVESAPMERPERPKQARPRTPSSRTSPNPGDGFGNAFCRAWDARLAYVAGSPCDGIRTPEMVIRLAETGLVGFLDPEAAGGPLDAVLETLRERLGEEAPIGLALHGEAIRPAADDVSTEALVEAALHHDLRSLEVTGFARIASALVRFRYSGAHFGADGEPVARRRLLALVSSPRVAELFLEPPPDELVRGLEERGVLSTEEARLARRLPLASDLCVVPAPGSGADLATLLPVILRLRDHRSDEEHDVRVGAGGALGTPGAIAAAFLLGADFVRTAAIQLAAGESALSEAVKTLLRALDFGDTTLAPAPAGFALGARRSVVGKGTFFPARAQKLYELLRFHDSLEAVDAKTRERLERTLFQQSLDEVWRKITVERPELASADAKTRMAAVFGWYLESSLAWTLEGRETRRLDYQIPCDESLAAFNLYCPDGERSVLAMAERLMRDAAGDFDFL